MSLTTPAISDDLIDAMLATPNVIAALTARPIKRVALSWADGFAALSAFTAREGHCRVPRGHIEQGLNLFTWVAEERGREARGTISEKQYAALASIPGWSWGRYNDAFRRGLTYLEVFINREGHTRIPTSHTEAGFCLGSWAHKHRIKHAIGHLHEDHANALKSFPEWEWTISTRNNQFTRT